MDTQTEKESFLGHECIGTFCFNMIHFLISCNIILKRPEHLH